MNWEAIGAVGEILSALGVLVTLGYVGFQIRQNTQAMKASALVSVHGIHVLGDGNQRYITLLNKSQRKEALTPEERAHMVERFLTIMREFERIWYQQQMGLLSQDQFDQNIDLVRWALSLPEPRRMWVYLAPSFDPDFCAAVESAVLAEGAPIGAMTKAFAALDPDWADQT
jgi:hypothetical protein